VICTDNPSVVCGLDDRSAWNHREVVTWTTVLIACDGGSDTPTRVYNIATPVLRPGVVGSVRRDYPKLKVTTEGREDR
jgi:hypothetical protein